MNAFKPVTGIRIADLADPADCARIEAFLTGRPDATPFHRPMWSRAVAKGCGQRAHYLIADRGVLPLTEIRSPLFGSALVSVGFGVDGGILADDDATAAALAEEAWHLAQRLGCPTMELRGGPAPDGWAEDRQTYAGFVRELPPDPDAILASIPRKQRAEVRKGLSLGLDMRVDHDLDAHYRVYSESVRNLGTPVFPRALFAAMLAEFGADADILTVSKDGRPLAGVLSLYHKETVYPYWGGGIFDARASRANEVMYYELMRHAVGRGCTRFDFGRSKVGTGAFAFKKNWGFEPQPLRYAIRTTPGAAPRSVNPMSPKYRLQVAAWKRLPLWLANRLGPPIARGLG